MERNDSDFPPVSLSDKVMEHNLNIAGSVSVLGVWPASTFWET